MSDDTVKKADFSEEFQKLLPQAQSVASSGNVEGGCELLLSLEKQSRLANDVVTLKAIVGATLQLCAHYKRWELLNHHIDILSKRRSQKSGAITVLVQKSMEFLPCTPSESVKMELIHHLRQVAEGKMYLEKERATLTQMLSKIKEARGEIAEAASILQEVHVETFGAMTKLEKTEFILEQVRLTLAKKDYVRANILSKKILRRTLEEEGFQECKLKFYRLLIEYETQENNTLELCRHYMAIYRTLKDRESEEWKDILRHAVIFVVLTTHSDSQSELLNTLSNEKRVEEMPEVHALLTQFITKEIIAYPLPQDKILWEHAVFKDALRGGEWYKTLHTRVTEHNIRVIATHYDRIQLGHLANMIGLSEQDAEDSISQLVSNGSIYAKMNRPAKLISFRATQPPEQQLSAWSGTIDMYLFLCFSFTYSMRSGCGSVACPRGNHLPLNQQRKYDSHDLIIQNNIFVVEALRITFL